VAQLDTRGGGDARATRARRAWSTLALLAVTTCSYAPAVFGPPFYTKGEPREAVVSQRMLAHGELILPRRSDTEIARKPPLFHWLAASVAAAAGGVSEATMRIPSLVASLAILALTTLAGHRAFGTAAGLAAGVVLSTSFQWLASSVTARVDMVLAAAVAAALLAFLRARARGDAFPLAFWLGCSLGVLAKGPVGFVLPVLVVTTFLAAGRDLAYLQTVRWGPALAVAAMPLCWYVLAWARGGDEFLRTVLAENFQRMVDADAGEVGHRHTFLYYLPVLAAGLAPWSVLAPSVARDLWQRRLDDPTRFAVVWILVTLAFYSLAESKRGVYLLSAYPAFALLAGDWLARRLAEARARPGEDRQPLPWASRAVLFALGAVATCTALQSLGVATFALFAPVLSPGDQANLAALATIVERHALATLAWAAFTAVFAMLLARSLRRGALRPACAATALMVWGTAAFGGATVFGELARSQSVKTFIDSAVARLPPEAPLYFYAASSTDAELYFFRSFEYAATFYAERPLTVVHDLADAGEGRKIWFVAADPTLRALSSRSAHTEYRFTEVARYTYGDNPRRTAVVFVEATRGAT
jgi:4-amino-4-deoxy-L-arabinose transferase-like glycosyltransferase